MKIVNLARCHSFTDEGYTQTPVKLKKTNSLSSLREVAKVTSATEMFQLRRSSKVENFIKSNIDEYFDFNLSLQFEKEDCLENINAAEYVYLGSVRKSLFNQTGLTLDKDGNLLFIKGKRADLFKGLYQKYISSYKYSTAIVKLSNRDKKVQLSSLFINDEGKLIGKDKITKQFYIIKIQAPVENNVNKNEVNINLEPISNDTNLANELTFEYIDNKDVSVKSSFCLKNGQLYLTELLVNENKYDYKLLDYQIDIPIKKDCYISSVKRCTNMLQLEIRNNRTGKTRIFYLDPYYINFHKLKTNLISHKPPQNTVSGLGSDPHESFYSGQPFSSTRKANFSSKHIPLLSSTIDKLRDSLKKAKPLFLEKKYGKFATELARAIDPGFEYAYNKYKNIVEISTNNTLAEDDKKNIFIQHKNAFNKASSSFKSCLAQNSYYINKNDKFSVALKEFMSDLNENDSLLFKTIDQLSVFFGISAGGKPFPIGPGWFAGIVASLQSNYILQITKKNDGLRFEFIHKSNKALTLLAGTGQGLEEDYKFIQAANIDIVTWVPAEANLIMVTNILKGSSFGFDIEEKNVNTFLETLTDEQKHLWIEDFIVDETKIESYKEHNLVILLEAKSELRAQLGFMANSNTYLVLPRTALGIKLALGLLNLKYINRTVFDKNHHIGQKETPELSTEFINFDANIFSEAKIMPIAMKSGYMMTDNVWCFPLPLQEDSYKIFSYHSPPFVSQYKDHLNNQQTNELLKTDENDQIQFVNIDSSTLPKKVSALIYNIYQYFSQKTESDTNFEQIYTADKLKTIKIHPEYSNLVTRLKNNFCNTYNTINIGTLINLSNNSELKNLEYIVKDLHENADRNSLYKTSNLFISCSYQMTAKKYNELKNTFEGLLKKIEVKQKEGTYIDKYESEFKYLQDIHSLLIEKKLDKYHPNSYFLKKLNIQRHTSVDNPKETLPLVIFRGKKNHQIGLIKQIGELEFADYNNQLPVVKKYLLHER